MKAAEWGVDLGSTENKQLAELAFYAQSTRMVIPGSNIKRSHIHIQNKNLKHTYSN